MEDRDRKLLTEKLLEECWHEHIGYTDSSDGVPNSIPMCSCGQLGDIDWMMNTHIKNLNRRTFTTPDDMMAVKRKLVERGEWTKFLYFCYEREAGFTGAVGIEGMCYHSNFIDWLINEERFCQLAVEFLKEGKG